MADEKKTDAELLAWAAAIINREQGRNSYGTVTVHLQAGRVVRVATERIETPGNGLDRNKIQD
jgi:hypothetical protein